MARKRGGFAGNPLHQTPVSTQRKHVKIDHVETGAIEIPGHPSLGNGHADAVGQALSQGAGGGFHAGRTMLFGMARTFALQLPKPFNVVQGHGKVMTRFMTVSGFLDFAQVQHGIQQHGSMTHGKHEAIAVGPRWVSRIKTQEPVPQAIRHGRKGHGCAGMAGVRGLDRVHRQRPNGVDTELLD